jgi:hypothetical protein
LGPLTGHDHRPLLVIERLAIVDQRTSSEGSALIR